MNNYRFHALEVHTLHVRDFEGERLIQSLGEFRDFEVSAACAEAEMQAVLFPVKRIFIKTLPFIILFFIGLGFSLTLSMKNNLIFAIRTLGPIALFSGAAGTFSEIKRILEQKKFLSSKAYEERLKISAWQCALKTAPKKFNENDLTYIPINEKTLKLKPEELSEEYNLLPAISKKAFNIITKKIFS